MPILTQVQGKGCMKECRKVFLYFLPCRVSTVKTSIKASYDDKDKGQITTSFFLKVKHFQYTADVF